MQPSDIIKDVAPAANEPWVKSKVDKFLNTDLEKILKDKGVQTVIVTGTARQRRRALHQHRRSGPRF